MSVLFEDKTENKSLTTVIFERIRDDILYGKYDKGEKIVEAKLAEEFNVSRTPVREALKQLELDDLVENIPNRGVVVKGISKQDIVDIFTIRLAIEGIAVEWAIERMDQEDMQKIKEIYELMEFYTFKKDVKKFAELNTKFHEAIYKATKSRYLENVLKNYQVFMKVVRYKSLEKPGRLEGALNEHKRIVDALMEKDVDRAKDVVIEHVKHSKETAEEE
ncbi:MAG: GntR family transcriptional regulator [Clostridiales bacterium]|nr:MAG: GntR family transcriptional regulator [Clostridiales bacterium]